MYLDSTSLDFRQRGKDAGVHQTVAGEGMARPTEPVSDWTPPLRVLGLAQSQPGREARGAPKTITSKYLPCAFLDVSPQEWEREFKEHAGHVTQTSSLSCPSRGRTSEALMWLHAPTPLPLPPHPD